MSKRQGIKKSTRFEVFKRDAFTCQYCGAKAPEVLLQIDHLKPVAGGGTNDLVNLVTSCQPCNAGKGAKLLDDKSTVERQRRQMDELQERRTQLEMVMEWRESLLDLEEQAVDSVCFYISKVSGFQPNEKGRARVRRWLKDFSFDEILNAVDGSFDTYMKWDDGEPDETAWHIAFQKVPAVARIKRQSASMPYLPRLFYVQGILRNRFRDKYFECVETLKQFVENGAGVDFLEACAKQCVDWPEFEDMVLAGLREAGDD